MSFANWLLASALVVSPVFITGCGGSSAAQDTANAMLGAIFESKASNPQELALLQQMPEYTQTINCIASHLEQSGWTQNQHDLFMSETQGTGNLQMIDMRKFTEAEQLEHFGALFSTTCL